MNNPKTLFHLFMELPPNYDQIEQILNNGNFSPEYISESFCEFAEECFCEYADFIDQNNRKPLDEEIHSTYVLPLCELLLKHGLAPNYVFGEKNDESNIMYEVYWIDKPYVAADTLKLLLEHGGDPLLQVNGESIWHMSDFDIWFDVSYGYAQQAEYRYKFENRFHFWLVLRSFLNTGEEKYKDHLLYTYSLIQKGKHNWDVLITSKQ